MDRSKFRNRLKQYKKAREENPGLKYWEWKDVPKYAEGTDNVGEWNPRITAEGYDDKGYYAQAMNPLPEVTVVGSKTRSRLERPLNITYIKGYPEVTSVTTDYNPGAGALDIVSPEFDLFTLGRGLLTNLIKPKGKIGKLPTDKDKYYREVSDLFYGKSKNVGAINDIENSGVVRTDKYSGFKSPMFSKGKIYDGREGLKDSYYIVSNDKKGLTWTTVDALGVPNNNPKGIAFTPLYKGKYNVAPKDYFDIYKYLQDDLYLQIIPNHKVVPIAGLNAWSENIEGFADGGEVGDNADYRQQIINRADYVASNYDDAKDFDLNPLVYTFRKFAKDNFDRGGISNCTLSATGWIDPNDQYMSAKNIFNNPSSGYTKIDAGYALPGDLLIAKNPEKNSYHTMLIEGFNGNEPILRYSRGGHDTKENLVTGRLLSEYHELDNKQGGNHTEDHYFRYNIPNEYWLPELIVTPNKR